MNLAAFQEAVVKWLKSTFTPDIVLDRIERGDRLLEETLELLQSGDYPRDRVITILDYTYSRPKGEPMKELGGTLITLAAYSNAHYLHMEIAGVNELLRVWDKQEVIRKKQKEKPKGSPLPSPSTNRQVIAWEYELAHTGHDPATYGTWTLELSHSRPNVPEGSCRNLRPLYAD